MRYAVSAGVVLVSLLLGTSVGWAEAAPQPDQARWIERVRAVWHTHHWPRAPKSAQQRAERALLSEGKQEATDALTYLLQQRAYADPAKLQTAFAMSLLDLNYARSRPVLLTYFRSSWPDNHRGKVDWARLANVVADPEASEENRFIRWPDVLGLVWHVYETNHDPLLLSVLLDYTPEADGEHAEGMSWWLAEQTKQHPERLLQVLKTKPKLVWDSVTELVASDLPQMEPTKPTTRVFPRLAALAKQAKHPLHGAASRLLRGVDIARRAE